jgi:zinc protease
MRCAGLVLAAAAVSAFGLFAQEIDLGRIRIPHEKFVLSNGLTLSHEDRSAPIVGVNLWYHAGSRNERRGQTGFAHLLEAPPLI